MIGNWLEKRIAIAATAYDQWPDSYKEAFRLTTIVDRIPPTLPESIALLSEVDRLTAELTAAKEENTALRERVKELTQCDPFWYDASPADAFMLLKKAQERTLDVEKALHDMLALWERVHGGAVLGKPTVNAAKRVLNGSIAQAALKEGE
jgi:hypothetical protein